MDRKLLTVCVAGIAAAGWAAGCHRKTGIVDKSPSESVVVTQPSRDVVVAQPLPARQVVVVQPSEPPPPRVEVKTVSPGGDYVWIPGQYQFVDGQWQWEAGHWVRPVQPAAV